MGLLREDRSLLGVIVGDADDGEALRAVLVLQAAERRGEHAAGAAPRRPEVDEDDAPFELVDRRRSAGERRHVRPDGCGGAHQIHAEDLVTGRTRREHDRSGGRRAATFELDRDGLADLVSANRARDLGGRGGLRAVDADDAIARAKPGLIGRGTAHDMLDRNADVTAVLHRDAEPGRPGEEGEHRRRRAFAGVRDDRDDRDDRNSHRARDQHHAKECAPHLVSLTYALQSRPTKATWRLPRGIPRKRHEPARPFVRV